MNLDSVYLNPFQPFPEREIEKSGEESPRTAIEDNLSRAVFSALANADGPYALAMFLQDLAPYGSPALCARTKTLAKRLQDTEPSKVEFGLQTWPAAAMQERDRLQVLLIGISSSHGHAWTYDQRKAPTEPRPDAWVYVRGQMLLVFECKNEEHPLDATQISAYAHYLQLLTKEDKVPCAKVGQTLQSIADGQAVKNACADIVLDAPWSAVTHALQRIQRDECVENVERWLCNRAVEYIQWHIHPSYRGILTILEWLKGPNTPERSNHLRTLVRRMGDELATAAKGRPGSITLAQDKKGNWDVPRGAGAEVYVRLKCDGQLLQRDWLGRKADVVFWFHFAENESQRIGLEYYIQAKGSQTNGRGIPETAWNKACDRHLICAEQFERTVAEWVTQAPASCQVIVTAVCFNGKKQTWQGGGVEDPSAPISSPTTPRGALEFLQKNRIELWRFPRVGAGEDASTIEEAASQVRKPGVQLIAPLDADALASCGGEGLTLQKFLQNRVASIASILSSPART